MKFGTTEETMATSNSQAKSKPSNGHFLIGWWHSFLYGWYNNLFCDLGQDPPFRN